MSKANIASFEELKAFLQQRSQKTREQFAYMATENVNNPSLLKVLSHVKGSQSNVIRAGLASLSCDAVGGNPELVDDFSVMLSLACVGIGIHDDIIDKTVYTRFEKSVPALYGSKRALLVGDLLLVKSWAVIERMIEKKIQPRHINQILQTVKYFCIEVCEAETDEVFYGRKLSTSLDKRKEILWRINGVLEACSRGGAILGGGNAREITALGDFGRRLGFLFALIDEMKDFLNLEGTLISRLRNESLPFPMFYAAKVSNDAFLKIKGVLKIAKPTVSDVQELVGCCLDAETFAYVKDLAEQSKTKAIDSLSSLKWSPAISMLKLLMDNSFSALATLCS